MAYTQRDLILAMAQDMSRGGGSQLDRGGLWKRGLSVSRMRWIHDGMKLTLPPRILTKRARQRVTTVALRNIAAKKRQAAREFFGL